MAAFRLARISEINKEWWILLSLFAISAVLNSFGALNQMLLLLYVLPTLFSAYFLGRRHATLTAFASVFLVVAGIFIRDNFLQQYQFPLPAGSWWQIMVWGGLLVIFGYATGSLFREMHEMYRGLLLLLRCFLMRDSAAHDHLRRIAYSSAVIADEMGLRRDRVDNTRSAALLYDLHSFDLSPDLMRKLTRLSGTAQSDSQNSSKEDRVALSRLCNVLPLIMHSAEAGPEDMPLESRILRVAEEFDSLTHDMDKRTALPPNVARNLVARGAGTKFDPKVVDAFLTAFDEGRIKFIARKEVVEA